MWECWLCQFMFQLKLWLHHNKKDVCGSKLEKKYCQKSPTLHERCRPSFVLKKYHTCWMFCAFLYLACVTFSLFGFVSSSKTQDFPTNKHFEVLIPTWSRQCKYNYSLNLRPLPICISTRLTSSFILVTHSILQNYN